MHYRLLLIALAVFLVLVMGGFALLPREPATFGLSLVPGPMSLFAVFGLPLVALVCLGYVVYRRAHRHRAGNTALFTGAAVVVWLLAFVLYH